MSANCFFVEVGYQSGAERDQPVVKPRAGGWKARSIRRTRLADLVPLDLGVFPLKSGNNQIAQDSRHAASRFAKSLAVETVSAG